VQPTYRAARPADGPAIAALHTASWRDAYRGLLPDAYLDTDVVAEHAALWQERFAATDAASSVVTVVAEHEGEVVGFAHSIVDDDPEHGTLLVRYSWSQLSELSRHVPPERRPRPREQLEEA